MLTNSSKSSEVVRISSNPSGQPSVTGIGTCTGSQYRSVIFELGNYHPFNFGAQLNYDETGMAGTIVNDDSDEVIDVLTWPYIPDRQVEIAFDITSFRGVDGKSVILSEPHLRYTSRHLC